MCVVDDTSAFFEWEAFLNQPCSQHLHNTSKQDMLMGQQVAA